MEYSQIVIAYSKLENTSKRLEKTYIISELLKKASEKELEQVMMLLRGKIFPAHDEREIGVSSKLAVKAIAISTGHNAAEIEKFWKETGDLGETAEKLTGKKTQNTLFSEKLEIKDVFNNLQKLATLEGAGSVDQKVKMISKLLTAAEPLEAKYIIRTTLQDLRVGVAQGTLRDAIAWAYIPEAKPNYNSDELSINPENREAYSAAIDVLQAAIDKTNDFYLAALTAKKGIEELKNVRIILGKPLKVMLAQKVNTVSEAFETVGKPAALEFKYDGFRMEVCKDHNDVKIFTRRLEDVTKQFPEVKKYVLENVRARTCILDCEAAGYDSKTGKYTPFQSISQRIKRKYDIEKMAQQFPVELNVFDILYIDGEDILDKPFIERRKVLEKIIVQKEKKIVLSKKIVTSDEEEAQKFFDEAVDEGNEGLMFKNLDAPYKPGSRVGHMIKLKSAMDPLDVVIIGGEWGQGKRKGWITSLRIAIQKDGEFLTIGNVGTGLKEKPEEGLSFGEITELLKPLIVKEKGREVFTKPKIVISVEYEEIQKSNEYGSGYALRFPRVKLLREDRDPESASSLEEVEDLYFAQKK